MIKINKNLGYLLINFSLALYFLLFLLFPRSYNIATTFLIVSAFIMLFLNRKQISAFSIDKEQKILIISYLLYFIIIFLTVILHQDKLKYLDNPVRIILYLPVLLLLIQYKLSFKTILYSIPTSAFLAGCVACYQCFYLGDWGAFRHVQLIQGGDISMSLGMFSICIMLYCLDKNYRLLALFCLICSLMGILGSILSTARGGWIGVPFILALIFAVYRKAIPKWFIPTILLTITILVYSAFHFDSNGRLRDRINTTQDQITRYFYNNDADTSIGHRFDMWKASWIAIQEKPVLGWGNKALYDKKQELAKNGIIIKNAADFDHNHNQFIDDMAKRGILGLIGLLAIFFVPLRYFWIKLKNNPSQSEIRCLALCGIVHVISTMAYNLSQCFFAHNSGNIFYFFTVIIFYAAISIQDRKNKS